VRHTYSPYFSQTTIVKKAENKLSNEIGCIIDINMYICVQRN
jgi:hypothetical protein